MVRFSGGRGDYFLPHPLYFQVNLSPFFPLPLGISEGKGEELKEGLAPLLDAPLWWGRVKLRDKQRMIRGRHGWK